MKLRPFATTLTIGSFLVLTATGICLLLHIRNPLVTPFHEIFSIIFVISAILHIIANWACMKAYAKKAPARTVIILFALLAILAVFPLSSKGNGRNKGFVMQQSPQLLMSLNAQEFAIVTHKNTSQIIALWQNVGLSNADSTTPLKDLASSAKKDPIALLGESLKISK
ncbi:MAG: DUF4405 domain-containing protein [Fibrobacteraceae bacterium]